MYEVDGVFIDRDKERSLREQRRSKGNENSNISDDENAVVYEERTQVVRLILYPDLKKLQSVAGNNCSLDAVRGLIDAFIGHPIVRSADFLEDYGAFWQRKFKDQKVLERVCQYIEDWITAAGVFMFGYLVWSVSAAIGTKEKVFWVTSTWSLNINQVELDNAYT
jgi:hypothetical protein